jgi:hypothetical protein
MVNSSDWGHWSITFFVASDIYSRDALSFFGELPFSVGSQGPQDGFLGSKERQRYIDACAQWQRGECPVGTLCYLDKKWLYDKAVPVERMGRGGCTGYDDFLMSDGSVKSFRVHGGYAGSIN